MADEAPVKHWMSGVSKTMKHGALRATARRAGLIKGGERLSMGDVEKLKGSSNPVTRRRATLAETFMKSKH